MWIFFCAFFGIMLSHLMCLTDGFKRHTGLELHQGKSEMI